MNFMRQKTQNTRGANFEINIFMSFMEIKSVICWSELQNSTIYIFSLTVFSGCKVTEFTECFGLEESLKVVFGSNTSAMERNCNNFEKQYCSC